MRWLLCELVSRAVGLSVRFDLLLFVVDWLGTTPTDIAVIGEGHMLSTNNDCIDYEERR